MLVVTTDQVEGARIARTLGYVAGVTVKSASKYDVGLKDLRGRTHPDVPGLVLEARDEAVAAMVERARARGASAVVGMRFDHRHVTGGVLEICAYGTAVVLEPVTATTG